jgi:hypothetical protein
VPTSPTPVRVQLPLQAGPTTVADAGALLGAEIAALVAQEQAKAERKAVQAAARAARATARAAARAVPPERSDQFGHLTLDGVRSYRHLVVREEERVGYWSRVVAARLESLRGTGTDVDTTHLRPALERQDLAGGRTVVLATAHAILPELPTLDALWLDRDAPGTEDAVAETNAQLTAYREGLATQIRAATAELIARYRQTPGECLTALPA